MIEIRRPVLKPYSKDRFELVEECRYKDIIVNVGYQTNGANIPRIFWSLFPPNSPEYLSAVVVHDYMCAKKKIYGYELADKLFYQAVISVLTNNTKDCNVSYNTVTSAGIVFK